MEQDDILETQLYKTDDVQLYLIPPPLKPNNVHTLSRWRIDKPVWSGTAVVVEKEHMDLIENRIGTPDDKITCKIEFSDTDSGELFASVRYSSSGVEVLPTIDGSKYYFILVSYGIMKIGLGMGFAKRSQAVEFSAALQTFRRHVASLEEDINTPDSNLQTTKELENEKKKTSANPPPLIPPPPSSAKQTEEDEDDDFGDFQ